MDRAEALAYVSRLFDSAAAGAVIWGDRLLLKRFLAQCSRTGSAETIDGYRRELQHFIQWRDGLYPDLLLRELDPALCDEWVNSLRERVAAEEIRPRTFNRRISAVSAMFRWASEPSRSGVTGIPRNPMPRRATLLAPKLAKPLTDDELGMLLATITQAMVTSPTTKRDYVLVKGSYLLGCRVSEIARLKWGDIEQLPDGAQVHLLGKGAKSRTVRVSAETLALFEALGRTAAEDYVFPSPKRNGPLTRQAIAARMAKCGRLPGVRVHPHKLRHNHATHSIRRGCDVFTLQNTLGHSSSGTTSGYVAANPSDSSSLRLG